MPDLTPLIAAIKAHQWLLVTALCIYLLLGLAKQGWLSDWVASKLTARWMPYYALVLSCLSVGSQDIIGGKTWQQALQDIVVTAFMVVSAHEFVVESLRNGKEWIVTAPKTLARRKKN